MTCRRQAELTAKLESQRHQQKQVEQQLQEARAQEAKLHSSMETLAKQLESKSVSDTSADQQIATLRAEASSTAAALQVSVQMSLPSFVQDASKATLGFCLWHHEASRASKQRRQSLICQRIDELTRVAYCTIDIIEPSRSLS